METRELKKKNLKTEKSKNTFNVRSTLLAMQKEPMTLSLMAT